MWLNFQGVLSYYMLYTNLHIDTYQIISSDTVYSFVTLYLLQISLNIFKDERSFFMLSLVKNQAWLQDAERQTSVCHRG